MLSFLWHAARGKDKMSEMDNRAAVQVQITFAFVLFSVAGCYQQVCAKK